jgi:hypothetical protein
VGLDSDCHRPQVMCVSQLGHLIKKQNDAFRFLKVFSIVYF